MNTKLFKGYFLSVLSLLVLVAAGFLLINNLGGEWSMQFFWKPISPRPAAAMLVIAACGVVIWHVMVKLLPAALRALRRGKKLSHAEDTQRRLKDLEGQKAPSQDGSQ